jgi:adenylate cyclase
LTGERVERRLAAVLAADVAGFSRLSGADEEGVLARLRALRAEVINPEVVAHDGRVFKNTGDGFLAEFRSVVSATRRALEIQRTSESRNADLPSDRRLDFRIGIHLGDVIAESDGDLMGDGVKSRSASRERQRWAAFRSRGPPTSRFATGSTLPSSTAARCC